MNNMQHIISIIDILDNPDVIREYIDNTKSKIVVIVFKPIKNIDVIQWALQ